MAATSFFSLLYLEKKGLLHTQQEKAYLDIRIQIGDQVETTIHRTIGVPA